MRKNIVLCGFMGSGKTTVGRLLAKELNIPFVDVDDLIVMETGLSITELFEQYGEKNFREIEHEVCRILSGTRGGVIAPGGGALMQERNRDVLSKTGIILFLDTTLETIRRRLASDTVRPLLNHADRDSEMERLYKERKPRYAYVCDHIIPADGEPEAVVRAILDYLHSVGEIDDV